ncbi:MAG: hypothetical protein ACR2OZ_01705 [Verrucomicrobiales bacterium]
MKPYLLSGLILALSVLPSCNLFFPKPDRKPYDRIGVVPQDFLFNRHHPLNDWLDTPVYVQMIDVPLTETLNHPALRPLNYRWLVLPLENPRVTIYRVAITRRQLLWSLAQDYKLSMLPIMRPGGYSYVEIRARQS